MDRSDPGSFQMAGFGIIALEPLCSAATYIVNRVYLSGPPDWSADVDRGTSILRARGADF
jgi:hypothetical protein